MNVAHRLERSAPHSADRSALVCRGKKDLRP
jgi:hypothetical protein